MVRELYPRMGERARAEGSYGAVYPGPIGAILTPQLRGTGSELDASPPPSAGEITPSKVVPSTAAVSSIPSAKANAAGGGRTPGRAPSSGSTSAGGGSTTRFAGSGTVLIGGSMSDASASAAPFDVRYAYVHSQPAPSSAYYSASLCKSEWANWWGCWNGDTTAPGTYVTWSDAHVAQATYQGSPRSQKFLWTWFSMSDLAALAGLDAGPGEVAAIDRADLLTLYMNDYRFFLQKIGTSHEMIDIEPDFWGFVRSVGDPHHVAAQVSAANPTDCGSQENSAAGLAHCLIAMARKYAPNTAVGLHLTCWDWQGNTSACAKDYLGLGAQNTDFLVADVSDRDSGWYALSAHGARDTFWTDQKATAFLGFCKTMSEAVGKPLVLWQIPVGNMAQNNTLNHYQDDKVDWFFAHMNQVATAHIAALLFGPGQQEQTTIESDGGNVISKTVAYHNSGGTALK